MQEFVTVLSGPKAGATFPIGVALSIGRLSENDLMLDDREVSRKHALIERTPAGTIVRDLQSGNGTLVGHRRVIEYRLSDGDIITVGSTAMRYSCNEKTDAPPPRTESTVHFKTEGGEGTVTASPADSAFRTLFAPSQDNAMADAFSDLRQRLEAIYEANQAIAAEQDLETLFDQVMERVFTLVPAHNGVILLTNKRTGELEPAYTRASESELVISNTIVRRAFDRREAVLTYDAAADDRFEAGMSILSHNIASAMCAPLVHQDMCLGVVYVDTHGAPNAFTQRDLDLLLALAGPAAIAIRNVQYLEEIKQGYHNTLIALANAIELRDPYTVGHTWRVSNFATEIGRRLGWDEKRLKTCETGGVLHDVGKIAVGDAILQKQGPLTDEEYGVMKIHPEKGSDMLRDIPFLAPIIPYCLYHHEKFDGTGYPFQLEGMDIPLEGRVIAVADTFDAMTSNRPYRKGMDADVAIEKIEAMAGTQFDPECAKALVEAYREGRINEIIQNYLEQDTGTIVCPFCSTHIPIPKDLEVGNRFVCKVCHRTVKLEFVNDTYFGVRISESEALES